MRLTNNIEERRSNITWVLKQYLEKNRNTGNELLQLLYFETEKKFSISIKKLLVFNIKELSKMQIINSLRNKSIYQIFITGFTAKKI